MRIQSAITTADSEPEPDLAIVRGEPQQFLSRHPRPNEIVLVVEVADSSVSRDRCKAPVYAQAGITAYWIVNLAESAIEVFSQLQDDSARYARQERLVSGDTVPLTIAGQVLDQVAVDDVLPE